MYTLSIPSDSLLSSEYYNSIMDYSAQLNNLGAAAAVGGNYQLALQLLKEALDAKMKNISSTCENTLLNAADQEATQEQRRRRLDHASSQLNQVTITSHESGDCDTVSQKLVPSCSGAFVYRTAFIVDTHQEQDIDMTTEKSLHASPSYTIQTATLLFNIGLVYHLKRETVGSRPSHVKNAVTVYKMALGLLKDVLNSSNGCNMVDSRLVIAIINNLGEIHYEQGQYQLSKTYFGYLSAVLVSMVANGTNTHVDQNDWGGMIMNTMMDDPQVAPAA